jgi:hypothetical protein
MKATAFKVAFVLAFSDVILKLTVNEALWSEDTQPG